MACDIYVKDATFQFLCDGISIKAIFTGIQKVFPQSNKKALYMQRAYVERFMRELTSSSKYDYNYVV